MGGSCVDYGAVTTPQTHYMVYKTCMNAKKEPAKIIEYYEDFAKSFNSFVQNIPSKPKLNPSYVDCSDGIGGVRFKDLNKFLNLDLKTINTGESTPVHLNDLCGAEFVHKEKKFPRNLADVPMKMKCVSFDGDADRIIYLYFLHIIILCH